MIITVPSVKQKRTYTAEAAPGCSATFEVQFRAVLAGGIFEAHRIRDGAHMRRICGRAGLEILAARDGNGGVRIRMGEQEGAEIRQATDPEMLNHVLTAFPGLADQVAEEAARLGEKVDNERGNLPGALELPPS